MLCRLLAVGLAEGNRNIWHWRIPSMVRITGDPRRLEVQTRMMPELGDRVRRAP